MIGRRVESRPRLPWGALTFLAIGISMAAGAVASGNGPLGAASALPILIGLGLAFFGRERRFEAEFTPGGIEATDPPESVPYSSIIHVRAGYRSEDPATFRKKAAPIRVVHEGGDLLIPSRLDVPSHEVFRFLAGLIPPCGSREVHPALEDYLARQESYFGPDQVWTYRAMSRKPTRRGPRKLRAASYGIALAGLAWIGYGASTAEGSPWVAGGIMAAVFGIALALATLAEGSSAGRMIKGWKKSSLVIGPQGMAMVQGDIQGEVRWPEILDVKFKTRPANFRLQNHEGAAAGILLLLKGTRLLIADIYDRPLHVIHGQIMACSGRDRHAAEVELRA